MFTSKKIEMNELSISAIAVAGVFLLAVVAFVVYVLFFRKRKTRSEQTSDEIQTLKKESVSRSTRGQGYQDYEAVIDSYNKQVEPMLKHLRLQQSIPSHLPTN